MIKEVFVTEYFFAETKEKEIGSKLTIKTGMENLSEFFFHL